MREIFRNARILFVITGCDHCDIYKKFIDRYNQRFPKDKQIIIINCDNYYDFGVVEDPLIELFAPYINGEFPSLFFLGRSIKGANTIEELKSFLDGLTHQDMILGSGNPNILIAKCSYIKGGIFKKNVQCN